VEREWSEATARSACGIADYGVIGDCRTAALVSNNGSIDWLCLPHFSGPSVFASLLDQDQGGCFSIKPDQPFRCARRYVDTTAVLETTFETESGVARLTDFMPIVNAPDALQPMREILRAIDGIAGEVDIVVFFQPRPNYARVRPRIRSRGKLGWACTWSDELFLLRSSVPLELTPDGAAVRGHFRLRAREKVWLSLCYSKGDIGVIPPLCEWGGARLRTTLDWWTAWSRRCAYDGPRREMIIRSAITLKLMSFALSGAVVAAATTSLPESLGGERNFDYRYCWLRDAALTMRAFTGLGFRDEGGSFLRWLLHATRLTWPELQVVYDVYGRTGLRERKLEHLCGYQNSRPVRIGNGAYTQVQLDVYGGVVSAALHYVESGGSLQAAEARLLAGFGNTVSKKWREADNGIWEIRGEKRHYTFSKVMCWSALDSLIKLAQRGCVRIDEKLVHSECGAISQAIDGAVLGGLPQLMGANG